MVDGSKFHLASWVLLCSAIVAVLLVMTTPDAASAAYLDPASGTFIVQVVAAVIFGTWAGLKLSGRKVADVFRRLTGRRTPDDPTE